MCCQNSQSLSCWNGTFAQTLALPSSAWCHRDKIWTEGVTQALCYQKKIGAHCHCACIFGPFLLWTIFTFLIRLIHSCFTLSKNVNCCFIWASSSCYKLLISRSRCPAHPLHPQSTRSLTPKLPITPPPSAASCCSCGDPPELSESELPPTNRP